MNFTQNITHALFFFPGTFLHELLHLIAAIIAMAIGMIFNLFAKPFGIGKISEIKITSLNIIPNFKTGVYGSVEYTGGSSFTAIFVSSAPKIAWILLWYFFDAYGFIQLNETDILGEQQFTLKWEHLSAPQIIIGIYIGIQLLWAGSLSRQDWYNIFSAFGKILSVALLITTTIYLLYSISGIQNISSSISDSFLNIINLIKTLLTSGRE